MNAAADLIWCEALKLRRSKVSLFSLLAALVIPLMLGLFAKILVDPTWAREFGLITAKARASGMHGDWKGFFSILTQAIAVAGVGIFGLLQIWVFGREFSDRTMKDLLATPVRRHTIVAAKFAVASGWCGALSMIVYLGALGVGAVVGLPGWSGTILGDATARYAAAAALTVVLSFALGFAACVGRGGYLPAIGTMFAVLFFSQILAALGVGAWFPWSVPALLSGAAGHGIEAPGPFSYVLVIAVAVAAVLATMSWWNRADQR